MDLLPTAEQDQLRNAVREFCHRSAPLAVTREYEGGFSRKLWDELAELGLFGLCVPESSGGVGLNATDAVLVFAELGRTLVPGPLITTHLAASALPDAADGRRVFTSLETGDEPLLVEHLECSDGVLIIDDDAVSLTPAPLVGAELVRSLDPLTPLHRLARIPSGSPLGGPELARFWRQHGAVRTAATQLGIAEATLDQSVRHVGEREQFGKPVGSFQAVKHLCSDMLVRVETARSAVHAAAATLDAPEVGSADRAVSVAKFLADQAAVENSLAAIQLHGGMGFTWEVDLHLYLKRARVHASRFGTADAHAERLAEELSEPPAATS